MFRLTDVLTLLPLALAARVIWSLLRPSASRTPGRILVDALAIAYAMALLQIVLGFQTLGGLGADFHPWSHVNLVPLRTIAEIARPGLAGGALGQVIGNVVLFVPLGILLPVTTSRFRTFKSVAVAGLLVSIGIELLQLIFLFSRLMERAADIDDVILNTTGAVLGYAVWAIFVRRFAVDREGSRLAAEADA